MTIALPVTGPCPQAEPIHCRRVQRSEVNLSLALTSSFPFIVTGNEVFIFFNEHETEVLVLFPKPSLLRLANDFQIPCKWEVFINIDTHTYIHEDKWHHSLLCYFWTRPSFIMPCLCNSRTVVGHDLNRQSSSPSEEMGEKMKHK